MLSDDVTAVYVSIEPAEAEKVRKNWENWGAGVRLVMLNSPYRLFLEPLLKYIVDIEQKRQPGETLTIVVPEFVSDNSMAGALHMNTVELLKSQLKRQENIVITSVPYLVEEKHKERLRRGAFLKFSGLCVAVVGKKRVIWRDRMQT